MEATFKAGTNFQIDSGELTATNFFTLNTDGDDNELTVIALGANYFVDNTCISVNYEIRDNKLNTDLGNLLTVQMQVTL